MKRYTLIIYILLFTIFGANAVRTLSGRITDAESDEPVAFASVLVNPGNHGVLTDEAGVFSLPLPEGKYEIRATSIGYDPAQRTVRLTSDMRVDLKMKSRANMLGEVTIVAKETDGLTSTSRIDREAMNHLQPTSFTDLLELLPGQISKDPDMGSANPIALRETGNLSAKGVKTQNSDYDISSLGTLFLVDGAPINGDANLQSVGTAADDTADRRNLTNRGVDMRSIPTDNIQSVEVVRGIPSAEYGNLTSGLVKIRRIATSTPMAVRFKADEYSKLVSAGKGFALGRSPFVLNVDAGYLDSKVDPRNVLENYRRLTGSLRLNYRGDGELLTTRFNAGFDYTGSFDNARNDPDLNHNKVDYYRSRYNRIAFTGELSMTLNRSAWLTDYELTLNASYQIDRLHRVKQVAPQRASVAPTSMEAGEHEGSYLLGEYIADYRSDGRPMNLFLKAKAGGERSAGSFTTTWKLGLEWSRSKNYGEGQVYDLTRPLAAAWTSRPRRFADIPALDVLSLFIEDRLQLTLPRQTLTLQIGLRSIQLPSLSRDYYISRRPYLDPRVNLGYTLTAGDPGGSPLRLTLTGGYGLNTKMPTVDYLYPQVSYMDFIQLNYYDVNAPAERSLVSLRTYIQDAANRDIRPARNHKWELRLGAEWSGNHFSVTLFRENMESGFRYSSIYEPYLYKAYDPSAIDPATLTGQPVLAELPWSEARVLDGYRRATNGTRIRKQGVEFTLNTARWKALRTSLIVTGAWFRSTYSNSQTLYETVNDVVDGTAVCDRYVGRYDYDDGRENEQFNTNFMFDTQIPRWGLIFSTSLQCMWYVKTTRLPVNGVPVDYLSAADGELHPYDPSALPDQALQYLVKTYNEESFLPYRIPFAGYVNLKATKQVGRWLRLSLFVNRLLDFLPSYTANGLTVRRSADPYFGMEINLTL